MKIHWEKVLPFILVTFLCLLAGRYLGGIYLAVYRCLITLLVGNFAFFLLGWIGLRYNQHFSKEHIERGETIKYSFYIQQTQPLSSHKVRLDFHKNRVNKAMYPEDLTINLKRREKEERSYTVQALHRGIYGAGLERVTLFDLFGLWEVPLALFPRSFYVYPRIYQGRGVPPKGLSDEGENEAQGGAGTDNTFRGLKEYRRGMELKGISWKHFARLGRPVMREDGINNAPKSVILMDRRPLDQEREDLLLENSLTYIDRLRGGNTTLQLAGFLPGKYLFIQDDGDWDSLLRGCLTLPFDAYNLIDCPMDARDAVTIISALPDGDLLDHDFWKNHSHWQLIALLEGMEPEQRIQRLSQLEALKDLGIHVVIIEKGEEYWSAG